MTPFVERLVNRHLMPGDELARIVDVGSVSAEMMVPEKEMADVDPSSLVVLKVRAYPARDIEGRVDFIAPVAETVGTERFVKVRTELPNEDGALKAEMTGVAKIHAGRRLVIQLMTRRIVRWIRTSPSSFNRILGHPPLNHPIQNTALFAFPRSQGHAEESNYFSNSSIFTSHLPSLCTEGDKPLVRANPSKGEDAKPQAKGSKESRLCPLGRQVKEAAATEHGAFCPPLFSNQFLYKTKANPSKGGDAKLTRLTFFSVGHDAPFREAMSVRLPSFWGH